MYQITTAHLRQLNARWRTAVNKYRGAAPVGLIIATMILESNGTLAPVVRSTKRPTGLLGVPAREGARFGYTESQLEDATTNIYCGGRLLNEYSQRLHRQYPDSWTTPNADFWLSVRLVAVLGFSSYEKLYTLVFPTTADTTENQDTITAAISTWIRGSMPSTQRVGTKSALNLRRIADELDSVATAIRTLDTRGTATNRFTIAPETTPGGADALSVARMRS